MKVFLVVVSAFQPFFGSDDRVIPTTVKQMPSMSSCQAVATAILEMSGRRTQVRCIVGYLDRN